MFSSTKAAMDKVMRALRDDGVSVVGVHGMPGVGKTTLVDRAAAQAKHGEGLFNRVVSLTVSRSPNLETIQNQAAEHLGLKRLGADLSLETRARFIEDMIVKEERVLVVLDDLWEKLDLSRVGIPRGEALKKCKSKIIITTRRADAYTLMGCREKIGLDTCSEQESRDFFKGVAGTDFDSREFERTADSVADECKGLPLALYLLAKALGDKPEDEWAHVLRKLRTSQHQNNAVMNELFTAIKVSYDYLGSKEKLYFLVCCLFPEDHNIAREELARYWFGLGLFPEAGTIDQARQRTNDIAKKLEESGLLLAAGGQRVKMHDVIRDVAIQIVSLDRELSKEEKEEGEERQVFIVQSRNSEAQEWPVRDSYEVYTAISAVSNAIRKLPGSPVCTKLHTLLLQDNKSLCSISDTFFENMNSLRLLNLSGAQALSLPLPGESLKMVRVLSLDRCKFTSIPNLGQLKKLAILSLRESVIEELPGGMEHLFDLRILDLTMSSRIRRIPVGVLSGLERLEELYLKGSFAEWHDGTDEKTAGNACFAEIMALDRLTVLEVDVAGAECLRGVQAGPEAPRWAKFDICVCRHGNTRLQFPKRSTDQCTLLLDASLNELPSWFPDAVSKKTERLTYANSKEVDMFGEQQGGRLASLKSLMLDKFTWVTHFIRAASCDAPAVFGGLRELQIHDSSINDICDGEIPQGSLKSLEFLALQFCTHMENSVIPQSLMKRVVSLERLHVSSSKAREVFASYKASSVDSAQQRYLGKLKEMRLVNLHKLERVWKGPARFADFSGLERVSVIKCEKLRNVFSDVSILDSLTRLEDLWIEDCKVMEEVIKVEDDIAPERVTLPRLKTLCLSKLPKLKNLFHSRSVIFLECPNFEYLHVDKCPLFQAPTSGFHSSKEVRQNDGQHMKTLKKRMTPEYY